MGSFIYLTPLFLYFPRFIPGVETQPLLTLALALGSLCTSSRSRPRVAFALMTATLVGWTLLRTTIVGGASASLSLLQLMIGPLILFGAIARHAPPPSRSTLAWITAFFSAAAVLEMLAPGVYGALASSILDRSTVTDGHRGISAFTPEPTYATITLVYFLLLARWAHMRGDAAHPWIEWGLGAVLMATLSTYLLVLVIAVALVRRPGWFLAVGLAFLAALPLLTSGALENDDSIRAVVAVSRILSSDFSDFLPSISLIDSSIGSRLLTNVASLKTPVTAPLGLGLDCNSVPSAFDAAGFDFAFSNPVLSQVIDGGCLKPQSYAAATTLGLGALALPFVLALAFAFRYALGSRRARPWGDAFAIAITLILVQVQLTSPIPWLLLYIAAAARQPVGASRASRPAPASKPLPLPSQ